MKVNCPKCERSYNVDDHRIPPTGLKMRCPKCQAVFTVKKKRKETMAYDAPVLSATLPDPADDGIAGGSPQGQGRTSPDEGPSSFETGGPGTSPSRNRDVAENDEFEIPDQTPRISFAGLNIPGRVPHENAADDDPEEFEIPDHKRRISFDGLELPPLPNPLKQPAPKVPKPTMSYAQTPPPKREEDSDDFPVSDMSDLEDPGELTLSDVPPPADVPKAPPPKKTQMGSPLKLPDDLTMPAEPVLPAPIPPSKDGDGFDLPELSHSIRLGSYDAVSSGVEELPPKLELPEDAHPAPTAAASLGGKPSVSQGTQNEIDFSPSVSGFTPGSTTDPDDFDLSAPISDAPAPSGAVPGTRAEIDFGNINLPSIDDEDSSDALPMALSSDFSTTSAPSFSKGAPGFDTPVMDAPSPLDGPPSTGGSLTAPDSLSPHGPSTFSADPPVLDAPPPLASPAMDDTVPPEDVIDNLGSPVSSLPPLGVSLDSKEPPSATAIGMGVGARMSFSDDIPSPADLLDEAPSPKRPPARTGTKRIVASGGVTFGEVSLDAMTEDTQDGGDFGELSFGTGKGTEGGFGASSGGSGFGAMSFGDSDPQSMALPGLDTGSGGEDGEFADFPVKETAEGSGLGDIGLDLAEDPLSARRPGALMDASASTVDEAEAPGHHEPAKAFDGRRKWERQGRRSKLLFLGILLVLLAVGAGLTYTPMGPFGAHYLYKLIPKPINKKAVQQIEQTASWHLQKDTFFSVSEAIRLTEMVSKENPGSEDLKVLLVYLCYVYQIRFGTDAKMDAAATRHLGSINLAESDSPYAPAAQVAQFLRFSRPLQLDPQKRQALETSTFGLAVLAEAYLSQRDVGTALGVAKKLDAKEKSARAAFLVARALSAQGTDASRKQLIEKLTQLLASNQEHLDAMLLLANTLSRVRPVDFDKARELAQSVIEAPKHNVIPTQQAEAHAVLAHLHLIKREYEDAAKEVALAEKLDAENVSMLLSKGRLALEKREFSQAGTAFNKALANAPDNLTAMLGKIETDIFGGELSDAKNALTKLLPQNPESARAHHLMGEIHLSLKEKDKAEKELKKAIELDNELLEAYVALSKLYLTDKKNEAAMAILDKASETVSGSPLIKKTLALGHVAREDFPAAIIELDNALKLNPNDVEAHFLMAQMYRRMESFEDAKRALDEVEQRNPGYPGLALEQGVLMEASGDVKKALSAYKKALSQKPDDTHLKLRVAAASHILGDLEGAETLLKDVIASQPESSEANFYVGETYRQLGQVTEAIGFLKKAATLDPSKPIYFLRYGMALIEMNDTERALEALETALKLDDKIAETYIRLGQIRLIQGSPRLAIMNILKGLALDKGIGDGFYFLAQSYEQLADPKEAVKHYRTAATLLPKNGELFFKLALTELTTQGNKAALPAFATAVKLGDKKDGNPPEWLYEALYRLGEAQRAGGNRSQAVATFKRYLEIAPEDAIDRSQVIANLDDLGVYMEGER